MPERLEEIVAKCLAKDKNERYQTAKDLLIDLRNLRRKLDVDAEIERTVAPSLRSTSGGAAPSTQSASMNADGTMSAAPVQTASSAEYVLTGIRQHKLVTAVSLVVLVAGITAVTLYLRGRNSSAVIKSIAVMPFVNEGGQAELEYLSDGMTDTLISTLSQLPNLNVKARSSVFRYKGKETSPQTIGKDLSVQAILNGRIAQHGDQLTLTLELVDAQTENVIWSDQYNRKQAELVSLQSDIARDVSTKLKSKLSGADEQKVTKKYTANPEAYQLYLQGRYFWNKRSSDNLKKATELLKAATEKDSNFALAYAGLADCYVVSYYYVGERPREIMPLAKTYAAKAIELDPTLAEPHATLGFAAWLLDWDKAGAEKEFLRAIELNPNYPTGHHWYSRYLRGTGRLDEAFREIKRAEEIDPLSLVIINNVAEIYIHRRRSQFGYQGMPANDRPRS